MITEGNAQYDQKKYSDAEVNYRKSITTGKNVKEGNYNLGNSYYKQEKFEEAAKQYESTGALKDLNDEDKSAVYHNLGNALLKEKKYPESIDAFKNALKANPKDNDTRYNLAYAQSMLQKQQDQKNKDNKDKKDDKNKEQQKKEEQQKKDEQQKQEENKEGQNNEEKNQGKKDKISKDDAEKILQALNNDEKKTQKKLNLKQPTKVSIEKQW